MRTVNIHEAKTHFSQLVEAALLGQETIIAKAGKPIAKICPLTRKRSKRPFGVLKGKIKMVEDFDAPLPDDILSDFEGGL